MGQSGLDTIRGGGGNDTITGGADNDSISGDAGNDSITGDAGNDSITGNAGNDMMTGGDGADLFQFGAELTNGGVPDTDTIVDYENGERVDVAGAVPVEKDAQLVGDDLQVTVGADEDMIVFKDVQDFTDILFV